MLTGSIFLAISASPQDAKKKLFSNPNSSVTQITESVGYDSSSYFIKHFKELEGITPIEFRNSIIINSLHYTFSH